MTSAVRGPGPARRGVALAALILLLAAGLRFFRLDHQSYWNDEGNTRVQAGRGPAAIVRNTAADIHPPGYYLAASGWRALLGESEFGLRSFSAFAGVALVALVYRLGRRWAGREAALAAALLAAINPFLIYYSQEARMYSLAAALATASYLFFCELERTGWRSAGRRGWAAGGYVVTTAAGLYTHYAFGFVLLAQNSAWLIALIRQRSLPGLRTSVFSWLMLQAATALLYLPWLPIAYRQLSGWPAGREVHPLGETLMSLGQYLAYGDFLRQAGNLAAVGLLALAALLAAGLWRSARRAGASIAIWLLVPAGLTAAFGLLSQTFAKFLVVAAPPLCLLLGGAWGEDKAAREKAAAAAVRWAALGAIIYASGVGLSNLYFNPAYFRDDYRGIAEYLRRIQRPGDAVITIAPNQVEAFGYYHRPDAGDAPLFPLPRQRPPDPALTEGELGDLAARYDRLFVLFWAEAQADPDGVVESWLNARAFKAGDEWFGGVRLATYAAAQPAEAPNVLVGARFGDHIRLIGYSLNAVEYAPGDILQITLFWQTDAPLADRYKVFVHLADALDQPPVAQQDGEPGGGLRPTTGWPAGDRIADNHGVLLVQAMPPGRYILVTGLYNLLDGARLPVTLDSFPAGDRLILDDIILK